LDALYADVSDDGSNGVISYIRPFSGARTGAWPTLPPPLRALFISPPPHALADYGMAGDPDRSFAYAQIWKLNLNPQWQNSQLLCCQGTGKAVWPPRLGG
jgi:hypothetical protein